MGMDFDGAGGDFHWTSSGWRQVLERAEAAGWQPTGTGPPSGILKAAWAGTYCSNDGQRFYARDARLMAQALESCLAKIPEAEREAYRDFIAFCRAGSFRLY